MEGREKSNNDSYHTMHVYIPSYQFQNMNVNNLKDNLRKRKTYVWYKKTLDGKLLTALKEKAQLYVDEAGLTRNKKNKKR